MVWDQLDTSKTHVAYAIVAVFSTIFALCSLFVKEKLYLGEASVATLYGLIVGPHALNWFNPFTWGNYFNITLEISRILLCVEIVAVSVELPKKYVLHHWFPLFLLLIPCMTAGWLIIGAFVYAIIPGLTFGYGLLISACVTATDPILAQAVVGKGKFAKRVPAHLRNLLSAESACNDGVSVPFVYLALNIILHEGDASKIAKNWICVTVLYECLFGAIMGAIFGYSCRKALRFAEGHDLIDRESFLAFYIMLATLCAGFGSILGVDDLLASFAAGTAFSWDGWFTDRTEESNVSTVIDVLLNMAYFVYFGTIVPWSDFNNAELGLNCWRLICLAIVVLLLRRLPAVLLTKFINPDLKNWKEAFFVGHFGPIGVGAVFAAIIAIADLEADILHISHGPTTNYPTESEYYQLIRIIWPTVCFLIITSIIVHGSSVAVLVLGRQLQSMTFTMTWTKAESGDIRSGNWFNRLPKIERSGTSFSIKRIDTMAPSEEGEFYSGSSDEKFADEKQNARLNANIGMERFNEISANPTIETSGVPVKPSGGANRKKKKRLLKHKRSKKRKAPPVSETLDLKNGRKNHPDEDREANKDDVDEKQDTIYYPVGNEPSISSKNNSISEIDEATNVPLDKQKKLVLPLQKIISNATQHSDTSKEVIANDMEGTIHVNPEAMKKISENFEIDEDDIKPVYDEDGQLRIPTQAINYKDKLVIEDQHGEVLHTVPSRSSTLSSASRSNSLRSRSGTVRKLATSLGFFPCSEAEEKKEQNDSADNIDEPPSIANVLEKEPSKRSTTYKSKGKSRSNTTASKSALEKVIDFGDVLLQKNVAPRRTKKLHGFRVDDDIIIENEDGEILGRYKVNVKKQKALEAKEGLSEDQYNRNLVGKALKYFGLNKRREILDEEMNQMTNGDLIPGDGEVVDLGIEDKIKHFINADSSQAVVTLPPHLRKSHLSSSERNAGLRSNRNKQDSRNCYEETTSEEYNSHQNDDSFEDSSSNNSTYSSDSRDVSLEPSDPLYSESKFEKARRSAALDKSRRKSDDEEE